MIDIDDWGLFDEEPEQFPVVDAAETHSE